MVTKVILVPYWVRDQLRRNGRKFEDLKYFDIVRQCLSGTEVNILNVMQQPSIAEQIFGSDLGGFSYSFIDAWRGTPNRALANAAQELYDCRNQQSCIDEINARLFSDQTSITADDVNNIVDVPDFGIVVVVHPRLFVGANKSVNNNAYSRQVAKLLYKYECMSEILQSPFGSRYIGTLLQ